MHSGHFLATLASKYHFDEKTCQKCPKKPKKHDFLKFEYRFLAGKQTKFGRFGMMGSGQSQILSKIFFIANGQKFMILSQKNIPSPKIPGFGGRVKNLRGLKSKGVLCCVPFKSV